MLARPSNAAWAGNKPELTKANLESAAQQLKALAEKRAAKRVRKKKPKIGRPKLPKGVGRNFRGRNKYQAKLMRRLRAEKKAAMAAEGKQS